MTQPQQGDRFYYTGDMANQEGQGTIEAVIVNESGVNYRLAFDDKRGLSSVTPASFEPGSGRRFWPLDEWIEDRGRRINAFMDAYHKA